MDESHATLHEAVEERISRIRDFINNPRRRYRLLKNRRLWFQLCSSLDVIEDTELAIAGYEAGELGTTDGARYLAVYGLLQALNVQQDAVKHLCESLGIPEATDNYPRLREIREVRVQTAGHPTKKEPTKKGRKKGEPTSYHFIARITLTHGGFSLVSQYSDGRFESKDVSMPGLIADQRRCVCEILSSVVDKLQEEDAGQ